MELGPGFTAITGETGAGKTMVLTGLAMLRGAKIDPALVRVGARAAAAEGRLDVANDSRAMRRAEEAGAEIEDGELLVTRTVSAAGRSRAALGGRGVPAATIAEVVDDLVAVHGQNDQLRLGRSQLALLDRWAGAAVGQPLADYAALYAQHLAVGRQIAALEAAAAEREQRSDLLRFGLAEIEKVDPRPGEDAELAAAAERLGHAEVLAESVNTAAQALAGDAESGSEVDTLGLLAVARRALDAVRGHDPAALDGPWLSLGEAAAIVGDVAADLSSYAAGLEADPVALGRIEDRRAELGRLTRKYGQTSDDVRSWARAAADELGNLEGVGDEITALRASLQQLGERMAPLAMRLHEERLSAAQRFAAAVGAELTALAMPKAVLRMAVTTRPDPGGLRVEVDGTSRTCAFGPFGCDEAALMFAANPGAPERPVAQAASGGELSRVMLAIEVVLAGADPVATMVFDEIDAGVGGAAALEVGRRLARLARAAQVIVVTHLPQVSAFADHHFVVSKADDGAVTSATVREVVGVEREVEIARMLAGQADSEVARAHARELLAAARN